MDASPLAEDLGGVLKELASGSAFSELLQLDLSACPCRGRARRLIIAQCDSDSIEWCGLMRRCWIVDALGYRANSAFSHWPTTSQLNDEEFAAENPLLLFATDGVRVRVWCSFGTQWRGFRLARVGASGRLVPGSVIPDGLDA